MKVILVVGARPNFIKVSPIIREMGKYPEIFEPLLVHTGQHYDSNMSDMFFEDLGLSEPDVYLGVGAGSQAVQSAKIMIEFEKVLLGRKPDLVIVVGDVNSTLACSIVAAKFGVRLAHVEAGLRSFDRTMPEEINRVVTDSLSDLLFTTCEDANENLKREGVAGEKIYFVGNVMIDTLLEFKARAEIFDGIRVNKKDYALLTLHRPGNVDDQGVFGGIVEALRDISKKIPILFPAHPRTLKQIKAFGYEGCFNFLDAGSSCSIDADFSINLLNPLSYLQFLRLMLNAKFVLTDSGGIQEETTILGIPCLTLRENTERPITIREGTNILVGKDKAKITAEAMKILDGAGKTGGVPKFWDGKAAQRIVEVLGRLW